MLQQQCEVEPAADFIEGRRVLADVRANKGLDKRGHNCFEIVVVAIRREASRLDEENDIERFSADARVEAHLIDDSIDRSESQVIEVKLIPAPPAPASVQR